MTLAIRTFMLAFLGFAALLFGVIQSFDSYPNPLTIRHFTEALPALTAMVSFAVGVIAAVIGLALLVPSLYRLRRSRPHLSPPAAPQGLIGDRRSGGPRPMAPRHEAYGNEPEEYEGEEYGNGPGGDYANPYANRHRDNGQFDPRRRAGAHR